MDSVQVRALKYALQGISFFITGEAGSGKSYVVMPMINDMRELLGKCVIVTGSMAKSAEPLGGVTIHSFAGIGNGDGTQEDLLDKVRKNSFARLGWIKCQVLVIEEIGMISNDLFTKLDYIARMIRNRPDEPFGGIQVIACGDFFQIPPVVPGKWGPNALDNVFAFQSPAWKPCMTKTIILKTGYRQEDPEFRRGISAMRKGHLRADFAVMVAKNNLIPRPNTGVPPVRIFCHKEDVDRINQEELAKLPGKGYVFRAITSPSDDKKYDKVFTIPSEICLKIDAVVMFIKNSDFYVNGTQGIVTDFIWPPTKAEQAQLSGNWIVEEEKTSKHMRKTDGEEEDEDAQPIGVKVRDKSGKMHHVLWVQFKYGTNTGIARTGLPLILAWALTTHKCQGMTIELADLDVSKAFTHGQAYVAMSRVTNLEGLRVKGLSQSVIICDDQVKAFYEACEEEMEAEENAEKAAAAMAERALEDGTLAVGPQGAQFEKWLFKGL